MSRPAEQQLAVRADAGVFSDAEVDGCDEPVQRYFRAAVAQGTPLARAARLRMRGSIKLGKRWLSFHADELLAPLHGYCWPATVGRGLFRGSDVLVDAAGAMSWKLLGLVPVVRTSTPDVARSAVGRAVGEGIWVPTALLPRYGVTWRAEGEGRVVASVPFDDEQVDLYLTLDERGLVRSAHLDRWGDPDNTKIHQLHPFGIDVVTSRSFSCGITMPAAGTGGWFHGTGRWSEGEFMRYTIFDLTLV